MRLTRNARNLALTHAIQCFPKEACGLLAARPSQPEHLLDYYPMQNLARQDNRFAMDPVAIAGADHDFRQRGLQLAAVFHSHPNAAARPSPWDEAHAWPGLPQLILAIRHQLPGQLTAWLPTPQQWQALTLEPPTP